MYEDIQLGTQFAMAISSMRHCLKIRNQYAHAHWHDPLNGLCFVDLEEIAVPNAFIHDLSDLTFRYVDLPLLVSVAFQVVRFW